MARLVDKKLFTQRVRHQIDLSRYSEGTSREIIALLEKATAEITAQLQKYGEVDTWTTARLEAMLEDMKLIIAGSYKEAGAALIQEMKDLAEHVADQTLGEVRGAMQPPGIELPPAATKLLLNMTVPDAEQLASIVSEEPIMVGMGKALFGELIEGLAGEKERLVRQAIRLGHAEGESISDITRRIVGTRKNGYSDGVLETSRRSARAIVRTVVNHTSNRSAQLTYGANGDIVKGWIFVATLDGRTSVICASLSGTRWEIGKGPIPPRHINCRSFAMPELFTWKELGIDLPEMGPGTRASKDGYVRADISFSDWLKDQPRGVAESILGVGGSKLFLDQGLPLDKFVDKSGVVLNLSQLKQRADRL